MKLFIDGAAGTTGLEIRERLAGREGIEHILLDDADRKDPRVRADALNAADVVVLCLPDDAAREAVMLVENPATRIVDASTAHRTAPGWTYGFPEVVGRENVARSRRVSNPGCYPTGFIALVAPLVRAGLIPADRALSCNAVSGYSGGGKAMIADYEGKGAAASAWSTYALHLEHKHVPEMRAHAGLSVAPLFAPAVVNLYRGMAVDVPLSAADLPGHPSATDLRAALAEAYADAPLIRIVDHDAPTLAVERLAGTDRLDLFVFADADDASIRLVALLDNLGKGAAGAAVQTINLLTGADETTGLRL